MAGTPSSPIRQLIRQMAEDPRLRRCSDTELLGRFCEQKDEAAFHCLVRRHGPMVLDLCGSLLRNPADAEDAFQASFLVLASKGGSVRKAASVASWLYGVAYRTACKARRRSATRHRCESRAAAPVASPADDLTWPEVRALVHEELNGLADMYRAPLVLSYLEGKTHAEAAAQLRLPLGTLKGRLERARGLLRARLVRRGLGPTALLVAAAWPASTASACVPRLLGHSTVQAASAFATGKATTLRPEVVALTRGVLRTMFFPKLRIATRVFLFAALVGGSAALGTFTLPTDPPRAAAGADRSAPADEGAKGRPAPKPVVVYEDAVVHRLAWARDGKTLVTVAVTYDAVALPGGKNDAGKVGDGTLLPNSTLELRDAKTGALKRSLGEEKYTYFTSLAFSPDGKTAAVAVMRHPHDPPTGGNLSKSEVRLLDAQTGALRDRADVNAPAYALAFSPDGTRLAVGNARRVRKGKDAFFIELFHVREGKLTDRTLARGATAEEKKQIAALIADLDDDRIEVREKATKDLADRGGAAEKAVRRALAGRPSPESRVRLEKVLGRLYGGGLPVNCLAFSPDGKLLAAGTFGDADGKVCLFDGLSGHAVRTLDAHAQTVSGVAFSPDGKTLVSGSFDKTVKVWDVASGELRRAQEQEGPVTALALSRDGRLLAIAASPSWPRRGNVKLLLWDTRTWQPTRVLPNQADDVAALAFSPDGTALALGAGDGRSRDDWPAEGRCKTPGEFKLLRLK